MPEAFSFKREFDFVRFERLCRITGRPAHEWDIYIIKELIDNALDADEAHWRNDPLQTPRLKIRIEYGVAENQKDIAGNRKRSRYQLFIEVGNRAVFPTELIPEIFAIQQYTSRKAFIKGLTRGALGNALKTLLGIPYALWNRVAGDWNPHQKPLSILCGDKEYLPTYRADTTQQIIQFESQEKPSKQIEGTTVRVSLDYFEQEKPRTLVEVRRLAQQYHLCNPHAEFHWDVQVREEKWIGDHTADQHWLNKFRATAPIHWYSLTAFQDLLGALHRKQNDREKDKGLSLEDICSYFAGFESREANLEAAILKEFQQPRLSVEDLEGAGAKTLYEAMCRLSPPFNSLKLGCIGLEHIRTTLTEALPVVERQVLYEIAQDTGEEPGIPFVIEVAIAPLQKGCRQIWTALNFTPTYDDPFLRRRLLAPIEPERVVIGLRELLNAYGIDQDTPIVLFFHLICPTIESGEFSKTEINHLPFKQVIGEVLDRLLRSFKEAREEKELQLEQIVFKALDTILKSLKENERFIAEQLLEKLQAKLRQDPTLADWLTTPGASERLRTYITKYQSQNAFLIQHIARPARGTLVLPVHPDRYFFVIAEHISQDILIQYHVNKIFYVQVPELEPVIIENGWLCRLDMALLGNSPNLNGLEESLIQCFVRSEVPVLILRDANEQGLARVEEMRNWLIKRHLDAKRIVDLGWELTDSSRETSQKLVEMMPDELLMRVSVKLQGLKLPVKFLPANCDIRQHICQKFEQKLLNYLWHGASKQLEISSLLIQLDQKLQFTQKMKTQALDRKLQNQLEGEDVTQSYSVILNKIVGEFFEDFMNHNDSILQDLIQVHFQSGETRDG